MAKKKPSLSLKRVSDAIALLENDIRSTRDLKPAQRKKILGILAALDTLVQACCDTGTADSNFVVASPE